MRILSRLLSVVKGQPKPLSTPRPAGPRKNLTLFEALDISLAYGYAAVNWDGVR